MEAKHRSVRNRNTLATVFALPKEPEQKHLLENGSHADEKHYRRCCRCCCSKLCTRCFLPTFACEEMDVHFRTENLPIISVVSGAANLLVLVADSECCFIIRDSALLRRYSGKGSGVGTPFRLAQP